MIAIFGNRDLGNHAQLLPRILRSKTTFTEQMVYQQTQAGSQANAFPRIDSTYH